MLLFTNKPLSQFIVHLTLFRNPQRLSKSERVRLLSPQYALFRKSVLIGLSVIFFICMGSDIASAQALAEPISEKSVGDAVGGVRDTSQEGDKGLAGAWPVDPSPSAAETAYYLNKRPLPPGPDATAPTQCAAYGPDLKHNPGRMYSPAKIISSMNSPRNANSRWMFSAHRGVWRKVHQDGGYIPENSLQSLVEAGQFKFESVELDYHKAYSGRKHAWVLAHDYTVGRVLQADSGNSPGWDPTKGEHGDWAKGSIPVPYSTDPYNVYWEYVGPANPLLFATGYPAGGVATNYLDAQAGFFPDGKKFTIPALIKAPLRGWDGNKFVSYKNAAGENETTIELKNALEFIGDTYPGMVVVLDIRHLDEVVTAMRAINLTVNCQGLPARHWVILKPFANVFPDSWGNVYTGEGTVKSKLASYGAELSPLRFLWAPVMSNRLNPQNPKGSPSLYPGSPGPDISQIKLDPNSATPLRDWASDWVTPGKFSGENNVVTFEVGTKDKKDSSFYPDQSVKIGGRDYRNIRSWRPPDRYSDASGFQSEAEWCLKGISHGESIGYNFKDDGMGMYSNKFASYRCLSKALETTSALTIENAARLIDVLRYDENGKLYEEWNDWRNETTTTQPLMDFGDAAYSQVTSVTYTPNGNDIWIFQYDGNKFYHYPESIGANSRAGIAHTSKFADMVDEKGRKFRNLGVIGRPPFLEFNIEYIESGETEQADEIQYVCGKQNQICTLHAQYPPPSQNPLAKDAE